MGVGQWREVRGYCCSGAEKEGRSSQRAPLLQCNLTNSHPISHGIRQWGCCFFFFFFFFFPAAGCLVAVSICFELTPPITTSLPRPRPCPCSHAHSSCSASASAMASPMWVVVVVMVWVGVVGCSVEAVKMELFHKFSSKALEAMRSRHGREYGADWPREDTIAFQTMLRDHDVARHANTARRVLAATSQDQYVFAQGNATEQLFGGGLHYSYVEIGTPSISFLVVLDTGSDLLWIPCDCVSCAPLSAPSQDPRTSILNVYTPAQSSTSKPVLCSDPLCAKSASCAAMTDQCPYEINYVSANTSTSGMLYEDDMYFMREAGGSDVKLPIYLGCGQMQTGSLLKGAAPDGLMGLGTTPISVPSKLASTGQVPDSFSMCISPTGAGMLTFGDEGPATQLTTPIIDKSISGLDTYIVEIDSVTVGSTPILMASMALFDTGTSFTYLSKTAYPQFVAAYDAQMTLPKYTFNNWDLCYETSNTDFEVPVVSLALQGGSSLDVVSGLKSIIDDTGVMVAVCVTVMDSGAALSIIGQNFMTNYSITYNRENMTIGWTPSDCTKDLTPTSLPPGSAPLVTLPPTTSPVASIPAPATVVPPPAYNPFGSAATAVHPSIQSVLLVLFTLSVAFLI